MESSIIEVEAKDITPRKDFDIDAYIAKRKEFIEKVNAIMVEGKDYHLIQGRKSMAKGGAEKIANIFGWTAVFTKDTEAMEAFTDLKGVISFVCNLKKGTKQVGQGRGAALLGRNGDDPNKTLKMAQKSAFIDAVIRASGLSDFYTQDLEDMNPNDIGGANTSARPQNASQTQPRQSPEAVISPSKAQYDLIGKLMEQKGITKEDLIGVGFMPGTLTGGKDGTASEMIEYLLKAKSKIDPNGNPVESLDDEGIGNDIPY